MQPNKGQVQAITSDSKRIAVYAGAGTGKTAVVAERIREMIKRGHSPMTILALTFTRKAAGELRERLEKSCGTEVRHITIGTFHAICLDIIRKWGELLGYDPRSLSVYDEIDREDIIKSICEDLGSEIPIKLVIQLLDKPRENIAGVNAPILARLNLICDSYRQHLKSNNALDYQGLLQIAVCLLQGFGQAREYYHNLWRLVFVDEYQDTDPDQVELLHLINPEWLFVVGDYRQSIYGWRGADPGLLLDFVRADGTERIDLTENYRSLPGIVQKANQIINDPLYGSPLTAVRSELAGTGQYRAPNMLSEGTYIATTIQALTELCYEYGDIVILARTNRQLNEFAHWFKDMGTIPFVRIGEYQEFWQQEEIRLCVNLLRVLVNPMNNHATKQILRALKVVVENPKMLEYKAAKQQRGLMEILAEDGLSVAAGFLKIVDKFVPNMTALTCLQEIDQSSRSIVFYQQQRLSSRVENLQKLATRPELINNTPQEFLDWYAFREVQDEMMEVEQQDKVLLMTVHAAKGLEFPVVFIMGLNEGTFPSKRGDPEEENRLFYVGCTRAQDRLYLSCSLEDDRGKKHLSSCFMAI